MVQKENKAAFAEDEFGEKIDSCITDTVVKFGE